MLALLLYITFWTVVSYAVMKVDKKRAQTGERRISEKTLFTLAWLGGSLGIWLGMKSFRHKTKKRRFVVGLPFIIIIQIIVIFIIFLSIEA
ncbi:DUF1294 domain-containing protein [Halalkalibacter hemicellulosilyticus]|uniref:Membrane protein n=1 Tax=Halalkalibacter hemicellulosilyticusJCM 9152 TaxID=1236971 RepID=W4QDW5_9BACI|nr:DUF1294 domain-containing protein [Halalkalibacter hemicellulosilyticus]GAE30142.1 membrane protein [Halalkalibacter hemicellulosilyticusJCM 9152]